MRGKVAHAGHVARGVSQREFFGRGVARFAVIERQKQIRMLAQGARDRGQPSDVFGMLPSRIVTAAVAMGDERDSQRTGLRRR